MYTVHKVDHADDGIGGPTSGYCVCGLALFALRHMNQERPPLVGIPAQVLDWRTSRQNDAGFGLRYANGIHKLAFLRHGLGHALTKHRGGACPSNEVIINVKAGQDGNKGTPLSLPGIRGQGPSTLFHEQLDDGQADPQTGFTGRHRPEEQFVHPGALSRRQAEAVIRNPQLVGVLRDTQSQADPLFGFTGIAVLQGVGNQVVQDVPQAGGEPFHVVAFQHQTQDHVGRAHDPLLPAEHLFEERAHRNGHHLIVSRMVAGHFFHIMHDLCKL